MDAGIIERYRPAGRTQLTGDYLGQTPPGLTPALFAPGVVSTAANELNCVFSPDGNELYFTERRDGRNTLMTMSRVDGEWRSRSVVSFSGKYGDVDPFITEDGNRLYFSSNRPPNNSGEAGDSDLWYVERDAAGNWQDPVNPGSPNSPGEDDYYTSISRDGTLFFSRFETHDSGGDLFQARLENDQYSAPQLLPSPVNTESSEHDPLVAPDGGFLIFTSNRPGGHGRGDLYICFRRPDGTWTEPANMGAGINTDAYEYCPMLSPDGRYLFFTRNAGGNGDIYWVDVGIVARLKPNG